MHKKLALDRSSMSLHGFLIKRMNPRQLSWEITVKGFDSVIPSCTWGLRLSKFVEGAHFPHQNYLARFNGYDLSPYGRAPQMRVTATLVVALCI